MTMSIKYYYRMATFGGSGEAGKTVLQTIHLKFRPVSRVSWPQETYNPNK